MLILESGEHARRRGARIYARLVGTGLSCDAYHMTAPQPEGGGAVLAMRAACRDAGLSPEAIDYVNAHGTGTPHNDAAETAGLRQLLGAATGRVPVSSIGSLLGHTLGRRGDRGGGLGAVDRPRGAAADRAACDPDPAFAAGDGASPDFDFIMDSARQARCRLSLSNSFAFGGNNAALFFAAA